jgi:hypothetical protein
MMLTDSRRLGIEVRENSSIGLNSLGSGRWIIERVSTPDVSKTSRGDPRRGNCSLNIYAAPRTSCALSLFSPIADARRDCRSRFRLQKRHERGFGSRISERGVSQLRDPFFGFAVRAIIRTMRSRSKCRVATRAHSSNSYCNMQTYADKTIDGDIEIAWWIGDLSRLKKMSAKTHRRLALAITCHRCY